MDINVINKAEKNAPNILTYKGEIFNVYKYSNNLKFSIFF